MGTYYVYCNHDDREFVTLSGLRGGGDKVNAVFYCAEAFAYLLAPIGGLGPFLGRWRGKRVEIVADHSFDVFDMEQSGYVDIAGPLVAEMRTCRLYDFDRFKDG